MRKNLGKDGKIIDAFLAFNEVEILEIRFALLQDVVDIFVIGEADTTFSGRANPTRFKDVLPEAQLAGRVLLKRIRIPQEIRELGNRWAVEQYFRNAFFQEVCQDFKNEVVLLSDCDEIPSPGQVARLRESRVPRGGLALPMNTSVRFANFRACPVFLPMTKAKAVIGKDYKSGIRYRIRPPARGPRGSHLTYMGMSPEQIATKHGAFSHAELDESFWSSASTLRLANIYRVDHRPKFLRLGNGLLRQVPRAHLGALSREIEDRHPEWWAREPSQSESTISRLHFSWRLWRARQIGEDHKDLSGRVFHARPILGVRFWFDLATVYSGVEFARRALVRIWFGDHREGVRGLRAWLASGIGRRVEVSREG